MAEVRITGLIKGTSPRSSSCKDKRARPRWTARPSDTLNLALVAGAPIRINPAILDDPEAMSHTAWQKFSTRESELVAEEQPVTRELLASLNEEESRASLTLSPGVAPESQIWFISKGSDGEAAIDRSDERDRWFRSAPGTPLVSAGVMVSLRLRRSEERGTSERRDRPRGTSRTCADGLHGRHDKGRPGSHTLRTGCQEAGDDRPTARFGYAGGWLRRLLDAFAG